MGALGERPDLRPRHSTLHINAQNGHLKCLCANLSFQMRDLDDLPVFRCLCLKTRFGHLRVWNAGEKEETLGLASQGEFLIGAGNTALVTMVVSDTGTSLVFSKSAQPR